MLSQVQLVLTQVHSVSSQVYLRLSQVYFCSCGFGGQAGTRQRNDMGTLRPTVKPAAYVFPGGIAYVITECATGSATPAE